MGRRGPLTKSLSEERPVAVSGRPKPPEHFTPEAKKVWGWLCKQLEELGIISQSDLVIMAMYCDTWCRYQDIQKKLQEEGIIYANKKTGVSHINPLVHEGHRLEQQLLRYVREMGLSPVGRAQIGVRRYIKKKAPVEKERESRFFGSIEERE